MFGQGCFGAKGLGKKYRGDVRVAMGFQFQVGWSLVFHASRPAVDVGGVREKGKNGKI